MKSERHLNLSDVERIFENRKYGSEEFFKFFSVLVPVVKCTDGLYLLYEKRARHMKRQPGEICFPGGELETGETIETCALRETREEIGIKEEQIKVICQLDTIYTYSNFAMYCYLGIIEESALASIKLNDDEVEDTFLVPVEWLMENDPRVYWTEIVPHPPEDFPYDEVTGGVPYKWRNGGAPVPVYDELDGNVIWGLTARITKRFIDALKNSLCESDRQAQTEERGADEHVESV